MADETTDVTEPVEPVAQPTSYIGEDGTFKDGWREAYLEEGDRNDRVFERATGIKGVLKSLASAERMIGKNKVAIPSAESGDGEWEAYYKAGGRPDTADAYVLEKPEDLPDKYWNEDFANKAKETFLKAGLNQKQIDLIQKLDYERSLAEMEQAQQNQQALEAKYEEDKNALVKEWGNAFEQKIHIGNIAVNEGANGDEELKQRVVEKFGGDPDFTRIMANLGSKFSESTFKHAEARIDTPADLEAKRTEVMSSDAFMKANHPGHKTAMATVSRLSKEIAKSRKPA